MKNQQCSSCGGDCGYGPLRHCQQGINHETDFRKKVCTSDEWLANATQSTRDLANKIKSQQLRGTGNQFRNETEAEIHKREINELKSEVNRLESELKKANSQTEEFERKWYLTLDVLDKLKVTSQSFGEKYPRNLDAKCKCEHWEACIDCHPTYVNAAMNGEV